MKSIKFTITLKLIFLVSVSSADCNLKVASSAGQYIDALERAHLRKYQNNSVCEVLNYEYGNCSKAQIKKLASNFNVKEVLTNYCQPHLPPPKSAFNKDSFLKGAELYSWRDHEGYLWYALLPGTNRTKKTDELTENKVSANLLKQELKNLPLGTHIAWNSLVAVEDRSSLEFSLPQDKELKEIVGSALLLSLKIDVVK